MHQNKEKHMLFPSGHGGHKSLKKLPRQNGHHFVDIFKLIFLYDSCFILIKTSLKVIHKDSSNNKPVLVQITTSCRKSDRPL